MTTKINKSHLILLKIIERDGNKYCADCGAEGTRWASWNFGIFLCIRCAGIHRNLGVHISKVKSVDLDSWTSEQLQVMELIGNKKSQNKYEAALPDNFVRPQTNYAIEEFIRSKYQYKRYCVSSPKSEVPSATQENGETKSSIAPAKKLVSFETDDKESKPIEESDDSLGDPDYIIDLKEKSKKTYHKVHSEGDLISFNCNAKSVSSKKDLMDVDNKTRILSLYDQSKANGGYQSSLPQNAMSYHKSYGSSTDGQMHSTTSIPASNQNSYLKQIQDKLTIIKGNLTSKFKSYEQPNSSPYHHHHHHSSDAYSQSNRGVSNTSNNTAINQIGGQTLSPDLWR